MSAAVPGRPSADGASNDPGSEVASLLAGMRGGFVERLGTRLMDIDALLVDLDRQGPTAEIRGAIMHRAHKTAGVAASFGFHRLGDLAREVEAAWSAQGGSGDLSDARRLTEAFLDEIERILDGERADG